MPLSGTSRATRSIRFTDLGWKSTSRRWGRPLPGASFSRVAFTDADVATGRANRASYAEYLHKLLAKGGVIVAPVLPGPAPRLDDSDEALDAYRHEAMVFLQLQASRAWPQLVIPAGKVGGAPVGVSAHRGERQRHRPSGHRSASRGSSDEVIRYIRRNSSRSGRTATRCSVSACRAPAASPASSAASTRWCS